MPSSVYNLTKLPGLNLWTFEFLDHGLMTQLLMTFPWTVRMGARGRRHIHLFPWTFRWEPPPPLPLLNVYLEFCDSSQPHSCRYSLCYWHININVNNQTKLSPNSVLLKPYGCLLCLCPIYVFDFRATVFTRESQNCRYKVSKSRHILKRLYLLANGIPLPTPYVKITVFVVCRCHHELNFIKMNHY